jgi:predicted SprT family Zn-dependent metalloprotease
MIYPCICKSTQQDKLHGKGRRVWNKTKPTDQYRCTVCKTEKLIKVEKEKE